jgi:hypothetical protein
MVYAVGDYATIPGMWWHGAMNQEFTVSVNNSFMTPYDVSEVSFQVQLQITA